MNAEQQMKEALDGKFFSFRATEAGQKIIEKDVPLSFRPRYSCTDANIAGAKRGAASRALVRAQRSAEFWTPALLVDLRERREAGGGSKVIGKAMNIPRGEVLGQLKRMGLR